MSEGGTRTRILSEGGSRSRTCSESSDLGDATGPVKTTGISYDLDGKFSFTKVTFLYITSQLFDYHILDHEAWSAQPIPDRCH